uniref:RRP12-like protein n=1 Tax=Timema tahoe TaxID=61484 RepID=A0A7R9NVA2_9NEOP|nr:unnamed protein product [Timema tahoe]
MTAGSQGLNTREFVLDSMLKLSFRYHSGRWGSTLFSGYWSKMGEQAGHVTIVLGQGGLTQEAIKKHDAFQGIKEDDSHCMVDDEDSALHKEMLAVLAAITEVIKANGGKESITEYFAALMTTLDACETEESITAVMSLLGMGLKKVPENVLKLKFPETSKTFCDLLGKFAETENSVILRSLLGCLSVLLRAQELAIWNNSSTLQVFNSVLAFATHSKPKVRKAAQHAVGSILKGSAIMLVSFPPPHHPAAVHTAKFCVQQVESGGSLGGSTTTLHALAFLQDVLSTFPKAQLKATCECILKMMTLGNLLVTSCSLQALHSLFASKPPALSMTPTLNGQLIAALYDYQPPANDTQPTLAWLSVMQEAHINLRRIDLPLCCSTLPRLFSTLTQLWMSEKPEIRNGTTVTLKAVILDCLPLACSPELFPRNEQLLAKMFNTVENGLKYQFNLAWNHVLLVLAAMFETCGATCSKFMLPCLKSLADLRDSYKFSYTNELEHAVGKAVKSMGPEVVLQVIPLQITGEETSYEFKRSWLLPVLRENIEGSSLKFFMQYFLPLATACRKQSIALSEENDQVGSHSYDLLQIQIWSLLPKFSTNPTDVKDNFKSIAKALGTAIAERKDLRVVVMSSLRRLIAWCQANKDEAGLSELARFSKNYVPILFNVYTTKPIGSDEEGQRLAAFETVKVYLNISTPELCAELFDKAFEKLSQDESDAFVKESVFDLLRALLPHQNQERLTQMFTRSIKSVADATNNKEQKKAYRLLEELCSNESKQCRSFVDKNLPKICHVLLQSLSKSAVPSKGLSCLRIVVKSQFISSYEKALGDLGTDGPRLRCLTHVVMKLEKCNSNMLQQIVPEAILCCKDINERCRTAAYNLLTEIGKAMQRWLDKPTDDIIRDYLGLIMAGLAGSPTLASATILALAKIIYEFRDLIPEDMRILLLDNVTLLMTSASREIVASTLSFVKVYITSFPVSVVAPSISTIVKSLVGMTEDCKRHFRTKTRDILDRLVRKFGAENISVLVPASDIVMHKRLRNLRKIHSKKIRDKEQRKQENSDDDIDEPFIIKSYSKTIDEILAESDDSDLEDDEMLGKPGPSKKKKTKQVNAWIQEDEDNIMDFTDVAASRRITATNPKEAVIKEQKKSKNTGFKTAPDGRLIIVDTSDGEEERVKRVQRHLAPDSDDDIEEDQKSNTGIAMLSPMGRKRKLSVSTNAHSEPVMKYQAGGSGIHRPVKVAKKQKAKKKDLQGLTSGAVYRSKKARGDMKRKGLPDPYAYVPLSRKMLSKRKKAKHAVSNKLNGLGVVMEARSNGGMQGHFERGESTGGERERLVW